MAMTLHARTSILLLAGMTAGLAAPLPDLTAQTGSGEQGRSLRAWVSAAREGPFHVPAGPGARENPAVAPANGLGTANTREFRWRLPQAPDSAVSPGRVFAFTLAGATIPLIPAMILWLEDDHDDHDEGYEVLFATILGGLAAVVTVPIAAVAAGIDSFPRTLAGTAAGFLAGVGSTSLAIGVPSWLAIPVFSVTMASVTTLITAL
ncbi:MAG: hypothetical protein OXU64_03840 [Gemmatimonadota bacterium]|nr:hypothetical protein [Gemmatimonadota bacterium]